MSLEVFPLEDNHDLGPGVGSSKDVTPRFLSNEFGDGYIQRVGDGINITRGEFTIPYENLTIEECDEAEAFLEDHADGTAFLWTPPGGSTQIKVICMKYNVSYPDATIRTLNLTLKQVFDL